MSKFWKEDLASTNARAAQRLLREKGLCGYLSEDDVQICVQMKGHDDGKHDRGWLWQSRVEVDPDAHDSRMTTLYYDIYDAERTFTTTNQAHAKWLADTLNKLGI